MIYIKRHNICFITTSKNASISIKKFFRDNVVQPDDVVNKINRIIIAIENGVPKDAKFFGIIRNPYERFLSSYFYISRKYPELGFTGTCADFENQLKMSIYNCNGNGNLHKNGQSKMFDCKEDIEKEIWCFDFLKDHINSFINEYKIEIVFPLEHRNKTSLSTKNLIDTYYNEETKNMVYERYQRDFELYDEVKEKWSRIYNAQ